MSRPEIVGEKPTLDSKAQVKLFAGQYRDSIDPLVSLGLKTRITESGLNFSDDELTVIIALNTPGKVQEFLNTQIHYNDDHSSEETEETVMPPRLVLQTAKAHCFEGALFAYTVNYLHGYNPLMVLLEASQDTEHNLVVWQDPDTSLWGANAHSTYEGLDGRPAKFSTLEELVQSYYPYYYSGRTKNREDLTLVGYSHPFNLEFKYGVSWMATEEPLWRMYYTYIDESIRFSYLFDESHQTHLYPTIQALKSNWIRIYTDGKSFVSVPDLPEDAQKLWILFWELFDPADIVPKSDKLLEIQENFRRITGTTPIDLKENAADFQDFLDYGLQPEDLKAPI